MPLRLIVGLGNPGSKYVNTRHNVGYLVIDRLLEQPLAGVRFFKPESVYMNQSGGPVAEIARRNGIEPAEILVICDDFAIPLGTMRIRQGGSSGGHNGLKSIFELFSTMEIPRIRVGIGPVPEGRDPADFVLERFTKEQSSIMETMVGHTADAVRLAIEKNLEAAMNRYNNKTYES